MTDIRTGKNLKELPVLEEDKQYIYVMLNELGKIKIGKTKDINKRYLSLCGSNGQGVNIIRVYCSEPTYLQSLEKIMHSKFNKYRIPNTEWFFNGSDSSGEDLFSAAMNELSLLFSSTEYEKCNELRKKQNGFDRN